MDFLATPVDHCCQELEGGGNEEWLLLSMFSFFLNDENILELDSSDTCVQPCEYTKNHWIVYFSVVNLMICELCLHLKREMKSSWKKQKQWE